MDDADAGALVARNTLPLPDLAASDLHVTLHHPQHGRAAIDPVFDRLVLPGLVALTEPLLIGRAFRFPLLLELLLRRALCRDLKRRGGLEDLCRS